MRSKRSLSPTESCSLSDYRQTGTTRSREERKGIHYGISTRRARHGRIIWHRASDSREAFGAWLYRLLTSRTPIQDTRSYTWLPLDVRQGSFRESEAPTDQILTHAQLGIG